MGIKLKLRTQVPWYFGGKETLYDGPKDVELWGVSDGESTQLVDTDLAGERIKRKKEGKEERKEKGKKSAPTLDAYLKYHQSYVYIGITTTPWIGGIAVPVW